jgi:hypothetical protein
MTVATGKIYSKMRMPTNIAAVVNGLVKPYRVW